MQPFGLVFLVVGGGLWWWSRQVYDSATGSPVKERTIGRRQGASIALSIVGLLIIIYNIGYYIHHLN